MKGKLIVVDGIDGSGKSSLVQNIANNFKSDHLIAMGGFDQRHYSEELTAIAKSLNKTKQEVFSGALINITWLMDLVNHTLSVINERLNSGQNIIVDRYTLSAKVYSLATTDSNISHLFPIYSLLPKPALGFYLDVSIETSLNRINKRSKEQIFYENREGLINIKHTYEKELLKVDYPLVRIDANDSETAVITNVCQYVNELLSNMGSHYEV